MAPLARIVGLVARRREEEAGRVQQLGERKDQHQQRDQREVHVEKAVGRQRLPVGDHEPQEECFHRDDIRVRDVLHREAGDGDREQQRQHQVIRRRRDVAHARDREAPHPEPGEARRHRERGVDPERLREGDPRPHGFGEVAQMADEHQRQAGVEQPAEHPGPEAALEQALEQHDLARESQRDAALRGRRRRGGDLERRRRARVVVDPVGEPAREHQARAAEQQGVGDGRGGHGRRSWRAAAARRGPAACPRARRIGQTQPVGFGSPAILQACFAGP